MLRPDPVHIIGGGLAGSEAAWQIASLGVPAVLHEMRPVRQTAAHQTDGLAELVCSNSFRSDDRETSAVNATLDSPPPNGPCTIGWRMPRSSVARVAA